ncbi:MAG: hypothetical protein AAGF91_17005 [Actinomycetota bacterium]
MTSRLDRRTLLVLAALTPLVVAACGSDSDGADDGDGTLPPVTEPGDLEEPTDTGSGSDSEPGNDDPAPADGPLPAAGAEVVVSLSVSGGFSTREISFQDAPVLLVTGDGRVITLAAIPEVFPGPLVVPHIEQTITPAGVQALLVAADDAGLLTDLEFDENSNIADAGTTILELHTSDGTFVHEAYALGMAGGGPLVGDETDPASDANSALQSFVDPLWNLAPVVGAENLGPETAYVPSGYQVVSVDVEEEVEPGYEPSILDWPVDDVSIADLASSGECVVVDRNAVGDLFDTANQLTRFAEGGATFKLLVRPDYPGQTC